MLTHPLLNHGLKRWTKLTKIFRHVWTNTDINQKGIQVCMIKRLLCFIVKATFLTKHFVLTIFYFWQFRNSFHPRPFELRQCVHYKYRFWSCEYQQQILFFRENDVFFTHFFCLLFINIFCSFQVTASSRLSSTSEATSTNSNNLQVNNTNK